MQTHTKVILGMVVGAAIGVTLGPKSPWLERDAFLISDLNRVELTLDRSDSSKRVWLGASVDPALPPVGARCEFLEFEYAELEDRLGESLRRPVWAKVRFAFPADLALLDQDEGVRKRLGNPKPGERLTGWIRIENIPLESGGFVARPEPVSGLGDTIVSWLRPIGALFMKLIQMVIVPLVFSSLLVGIARIGDVRKLGRMGAKTLGIYLFTTAVAITIGVGLAHLLRPGHLLPEATRAALNAEFAAGAVGTAAGAVQAPSFLENLVAIVPSNPLGSLADGQLLQIIFFATLLGVSITLLDQTKGSPLIDFFDRLQQALVMMIHLVMLLAPFGVAALLADVVGQSGVDTFGALFLYAITVLLGLSLQASIVYGGMVRLFSKMSWIGFMKAARPAQLIGFSTSSSSAALPVSMECAESKMGVSSPVASFVLPLGATVNMDGTALYQGVAAVFIAQVFGIDLTLMDQLGIIGTATVASIGTASGPAAGMITLAMVLTNAGIPTVGIALILGMDRILDMFRTAVNVTGDLAVTLAVASSEGEGGPNGHPPTRPEGDAGPQPA